MGWLYNRNYIGPDRRGGRFEVRFFERRKREQEAGDRSTVSGSLRELFAAGLKWVDSIAYFGPDRRSGQFSHFFLERRRHEGAGAPPPLKGALRQLRVRVLEADNAEGRRLLKERLTATALLADAQGHAALGDRLIRVAQMVEAATDGDDVSAPLQAELIAAEAMLDETPARY